MCFFGIDGRAEKGVCPRAARREFCKSCRYSVNSFVRGMFFFFIQPMVIVPPAPLMGMETTSCPVMRGRRQPVPRLYAFVWAMMLSMVERSVA